MTICILWSLRAGGGQALSLAPGCFSDSLWPWLTSTPQCKLQTHFLVPMLSGQLIFLTDCFLGGSIRHQVWWWILSSSFLGSGSPPLPPAPAFSLLNVPAPFRGWGELPKPASCRLNGQPLSTLWNVAPPSGSLQPDSALLK